VPEGSVYALLGPNGAGKTTLLQILMGLRRPTAGRAWVLGRDHGRLRPEDRQLVGYVAEGQQLPLGMRVQEVERFLAPLYPAWDRRLADSLRERFRLDPARRLRTLSRGERMKAALLFALAPRPKLLLMDEPFSGMDAVVKDELVSGLLGTAGEQGWTVMISSHDLAELEMLADHVAFLDRGRLRLSAATEALRETYLRVEMVGSGGAPTVPAQLPGTVHGVGRSGHRTTFVAALSQPLSAADLSSLLPADVRVSVRPATLREVFLALAGEPAEPSAAEEVAA
jgi:ABC-2 type transport system ATP-binding protein